MLRKWSSIGAVVLLAVCVCLVAGDMGRVLMRDVTALTFTKGRMTTGRRSAPVPQQVCRGSACSKYQPDVVQCKQSGWDGDAQWECSAHLEGGLSFGEVEVFCEGYDFPEDPYILRGSCGLEYTLVGETGDSYSGGYDDAYYGSRQKSSWGSSIFLFIILAFIAYVIYSVLFNPQPNGGAAGNGARYGGGGYPGGPGGGPGPGGYPNYTPGYGPSCNTYTPAPAPAPAAAGGGFWNGMLTGGLLGYMFGGNRGYGGYGYGPRRMGGYGGGYGGYGGGMRMGGGGGGGMRMGGGTRTGFGGTRRR